MKAKRNAVKFAGASALAVLITTSAFADSNRERNGGQPPSAVRSQSAQQQHSSERFNASGKITSMSKDRDGYRVQLDRGRESYWIPQSRLGNRARDLRVGVSIQIGGVYNAGRMDIDAVNWPGNNGYGYDRDYLRGVVASIDYRHDIVTVRDRDTGRLVDVDMRAISRDRLRRGDRVTLEGQWERGNIFSAYRIDSVS